MHRFTVAFGHEKVRHIDTVNAVECSYDADNGIVGVAFVQGDCVSEFGYQRF